MTQVPVPFATVSSPIFACSASTFASSTTGSFADEPRSSSSCAPSKNAFFHLWIIFGCAPNRLASSDIVCSPFSASNAAFALNSGFYCFRFDIIGLLNLATNKHRYVAYVTIRLAGSSSQLLAV